MGVMSAGPWRDGMSATSAGRFGGYRGMRMPEQGYLCWSASETRIAAHDKDDQRGLVIFDYLNPRFAGPAAVREEADWTTQRWVYTDPKDGSALGQTIHTLLFPGTLFEWRGSRFDWWNYDLAGASVGYPSRAGYRVIGPRECRYPTFEATGDAAFAGPWMVVWETGENPFPLLFLFEKPPVRVTTISRSQSIEFDGPAGWIAVCPLTGADRWSKEAKMRLNEPPDEKLMAAIETLARLKLAAPVGCKERFRVDLGRDVVEVEQTFEHLGLSDAFGTKPLKIAPLSPWLGTACPGAKDLVGQAPDLGLRVEGEMIDTGIATLWGPYLGTAGSVLRYAMKRSWGMNQTIAPVRVTGDPRCDELQKRLDTEIAQPTLTFGGDNTYDPDNIQDILHNLRVLGWATWSPPEGVELREHQAKRFANLERELHTMRPDQYSLEVEPVSGQRYRWQKDLWGGGATAVDIEWYNGMQLAGLWAGYFYSGDEEAFVAKVRPRWEIVQDLLRYFEIFDDWPTGLTYTALTRKCLWFDGFNFVWQGVCGAARLARIVGDDETADRAELLAARYSLARSAAWFMLPYMLRHDGLYRATWLFDNSEAKIELSAESPGMGVMGFVEKRGVTVGTWYDAGNAIGYLVPEQLIMQMSIPGVLEMIRRGQYEILPSHQPNWNRRFHRTPDGQAPVRPHWLYPSHSHFYHLDAQLFARSILLREPLDKLLSYTAELTGPVMECYLVARSPMVLFPTGVRFRGVTFDAAASELAVQFEAPAGARAAMEVVFERPVTGVGGATWEAGGGRVRVTLEGGEGVKTVKIRYGG